MVKTSTRVYYVVYVATEGFGKTHISIWREGDDLEWSYGQNGIRSCEMGAYPDIVEGWVFSRVVSVSSPLTNLSLTEIIEQMKESNKYKVDDYHLLRHNCWHFASTVLHTIDPSMTKEHYLNLIYKVNDFEWGVPLFGTTWATFHILQWGSRCSEFLYPIFHRITHLWDRPPA